MNLDDGTSINQFISAHTGLGTCIDGWHTHNRTRCGTVMMDHISLIASHIYNSLMVLKH